MPEPREKRSRQPRDERPPVVVVTGPTAAGKTALGLRLAERFGGEIVNADSMQVYRHLDIGTAKPTLEERARVPHHVIDFVDPRTPYNAGRYTADARRAAADIHGRGRPVFLVGGTGLYIRAFLEGLLDAAGADWTLRERLEREDREARAAGDPSRLHRRLAELDPRAAERIHPNDVRRLVRAIELCVVSRRAASQVREQHGFGERPYRTLHLALDPGTRELDRRIDARCRAMIEAGLLQEARALRDMGVRPDARCMQAIGYRHMLPVMEGSDTLANALAAMQRDTRRFARRQRTWLRSVPDALRRHPADAEGLEKEVATFLSYECSPAG